MYTFLPSCVKIQSERLVAVITGPRCEKPIESRWKHYTVTQYIMHQVKEHLWLTGHYMWNVTEWLVKELPYFYLCKQSPSSFQINYTYLYVQIGSPLYFYHEILCHPHKQHSAYRQTCLSSYTLGRQLYLQTQAVSERQQKFLPT